MIDKNFNELIEKSIKNFWDYVSLQNYEGKSLKYSEVASYIKYFHKIFKDLGIKREDKIALLGPNSVNWAIVYISVVTYGATIVPILKDFHLQDIEHILNHSDSKMFFCPSKTYKKIDEDDIKKLELIFSLDNFSLLSFKNKKSRKVYEKYSNFDKNLSPGSFSFNKKITNDQTAVLVYTSGTTGFSKGVMLDYNSLIANILYAQNNIELKPKHRVLSFLPLAHAYGCAFDFLFPFTVGVEITFLSMIPSPKILLKAFNDVKPQLINMVPLIIEKMYKKKIKPKLEKGILGVLTNIPLVKKGIYKKIVSQLENAFGGEFINLVIGGAPLDPQIEDFFKKIGLTFSVGYGMTECAPLIAYDQPETHKTASVGKVIDYLDLKIDSADPENQVGEILVRGENVMKGYYKNEKATKEVFTDDGWMKTGDLGILDSDGYLFIKGRRKNMILGPSGQNIYPEEIENKLNNMDFIEESIVFGEENYIYALVYPDYDKLDEIDDYSLDPQEYLTAKMEENRKKINKILPNYSHLKEIKLHPESFEKTPTKKIKRYLYKNY
ncbi:MAG: long-chain fatty acid--CoA ligase [Candidatus Mcinerneyibacterium aminivorans]|uniref:Long-chain fatty acid--CoA ligase n=1 Tax=Candidatus Mcinerneyibacterium aminivorans TaxID=2703815 RepID=A0A5D0MCJ9_9BACT|nr:MAG: long-chain fatty acid--CoA ligase [Candidatus Mcinerneyibacterium aminivorans]